jgi:hypothetical protein
MKNNNSSKIYNTRKDTQKNPVYFNSNFETYENFEEHFEYPFEITYPLLKTKFPLSCVKDLNITV